MSQVIIEKELLENNISILKNFAASHSEKMPEIIAVLKGNAYGVGAIPVGRVLLDNGIHFFAVAEVSEAIKLRDAGFLNEILILNATEIEDEIEEIVKHDLIATVGSFQGITLLNNKALVYQKKVKCHLKIDTGFGRFGFRWEEILENVSFVDMLKKTMEEAQNVEITGTYSHFQESYAKDDTNTKRQFDRFQKCVKVLKEKEIEIGMRHICNSPAFFQYPDMYFDAVRIGSAFTGQVAISMETGLKPVAYLESRVCAMKMVKKGEKIGYSGICKLKKDTLIGIVEAGYSDGVEVTRYCDRDRLIDKLRFFKTDLLRLVHHEKRIVEINHQEYSILGRIGMNNFMVDLTNSNVQVGDNVKIKVNLIYVNNKIERKIVSEKE